MAGKTVVELSGAATANLYRIFEEEENSNLILKILGRQTVLESTETTDQSSQSSTRKVCLVPDSWKVVKIEDILNWTTGEVDVSEEGVREDKTFLGYLRWRKDSRDSEGFSFHDLLLIKALQRENKSYLFLLASREANTNLGIQYKIRGRMSSAEAPEVQIVTPSIEKRLYKKAADRKNSTINSMMRGVKVEAIDQVLSSLDENVCKNLDEDASVLLKNIVRLEEASRNSIESIKNLKRSLKEAMEKTAEFNKIRGIQSRNLETALKYAMKDLNMNDEVERDSYSSSVDDPLNSSMLTNVDEESPELLTSQGSL